MEEADALCTRIGIMARGDMRCIGSATHLKNSIGDEYKIDVSVAPGMDSSQPLLQAADAFVEEAIPGALLISSFAGSRTYKVQRSAVSIANVWAKMEARPASAGILDWGVRQTSLEEVFLKIATEDA
jgi:ATP-binding cassette subfamily A (ABC1) protein 3